MSRYLFYVILLTTIFSTISGELDPELLEKCQMNMQMIDATGKIPSGIFKGNTYELGNFDECLAIKFNRSTTKLKGKYCLMQFQLVTTADFKYTRKPVFRLEGQPALFRDVTDEEEISLSFLMGFCIPSDCPEEFFEKYIAIDYLKTNVSLIPQYGTCQTEDDLEYNLTAGEWTAFGFYIFIFGLTIISTIYDVYLYYSQNKPAHILLIAFSIKTNGEKLLSVSKNSDQLSCLNGIRFISMMWVVLGHRYAAAISTPSINAMDALEWLNEAKNMYIFNAPVAVDTFFVLSGLLVGYIFMLSQDKGVKFNIILYYIHRYLRLTPVLAVVMLFHGTLLQYAGSGPMWTMTLPGLTKNCKEYWWTNVLYIANYYEPEHMCMGQTWYLHIDFQLFLLSPLILLLLKRWPKITMWINTALVFASMAIAFVVSYHYELAISHLGGLEYGSKYYIPTHTRYGPWLMGLMLGYYIFKLKKDKTDNPSQQFKLHPAQVFAGWIVALTIMLACLYSAEGLVFSTENLDKAFYNAFHRHGWSLGLCWVIFACTQGYGGPINTFLSWSVFQILARFSYTIYLTHMTLQQAIVASTRTPTYFSDFGAYYGFCGDMLFSLAISLYLTLSFESPMLTIEKLIFGHGMKSQKPKLPTHQTNEKVNLS